MTNIPYLKPSGQAVFQDRGITKFSHVIKEWKGDAIEGVGLIGAPLSKPSISHSGASFAPGVMRELLKSTATYAVEDDVDLIDFPIYDLGDVLMHVTDLLESQQRIEESLYAILNKQPNLVPITLGGDHSISAPAIKAFARARGKTGVIQFDAHHDIRNLEDGGPSNGTPFRQLIESNSIEGRHLIQMGIRNFANSRYYFDESKKQGMTVYTMKAVREKGILQLVQDAYKALSHQVEHIYLSVDVDVIDQAFAPGCPAISPGGMYPEDLFLAVKWLGEQEKVSGMDIVEIDPKQDYREMTSKIGVFTLLNYLIGKKRLINNKKRR